MGRKGLRKGQLTIREKVFKLLRAAPEEGLSAKDIRRALEMKREGLISPLLRDECCAGTPRIEALAPPEGCRGKYYRLTAAGARAITDGTVNSRAPVRKEWGNLVERIEVAEEW